MNLFLDDIRVPAGAASYMPKATKAFYSDLDWVIVRNYEEFVLAIEKDGLPELISFDHDLADIHYDPQTWKETFKYKEKTGYDCAKWLVEYCLDKGLALPKFLVHSQNPVGSENIRMLLTNFNKHEN